MRRYSQGFTLIELLVVVAIIGILSAVGVVSYSGYKASAEKKQAEITLNSIYLAEQEYKSNNGEYYFKPCFEQSNSLSIAVVAPVEHFITSLVIYLTTFLWLAVAADFFALDVYPL